MERMLSKKRRRKKKQIKKKLEILKTKNAFETGSGLRLMSMEKALCCSIQFINKQRLYFNTKVQEKKVDCPNGHIWFGKTFLT